MELTTAQFAERLGVSQSRIRQLVLAGKITARHLTPRILLIDEKELNRPGVADRGKPGPKTKRKSKGAK
jgi:excisionase family DNA binding protein